MFRRPLTLSAFLVGIALFGAGCTGRPEVVMREPIHEARLQIRQEAGVAKIRWIRQCDYAPMTLHPLMVVPPTRKEIPEEIRKPHTFPALSPNGAAYLVLEGFLYKVDFSSGRVRWRFPVENRDVQVLEADGMIACYVDFGGRGVLRGINATSGVLLWHAPEAPGSARMDSAAGRVYLQSKNQLSCFDIRNGDHLWAKRFPFGPEYGGKVYGLATREHAAICEWVNTDRGSHEILALSLYSGQVEWSSLGEIVDAGEERVHLYNRRTHVLMSRDLKTGKLADDLALDLFDGTFIGVRGDYVIYTSTQVALRPPGEPLPVEPGAADAPVRYSRNEILGVNTLDGRVEWSFEYRRPDELAAVVVTDGVVFVVRQPEIFGYNDIVFHEIAAYAFGGEMLWSALSPSGIVNLTTEANRLLVRTRDGWCFAVDHRKREPGEVVAPGPEPQMLAPDAGDAGNSEPPTPDLKSAEPAPATPAPSNAPAAPPPADPAPASPPAPAEPAPEQPKMETRARRDSQGDRRPLERMARRRRLESAPTAEDAFAELMDPGSAPAAPVDGGPTPAAKSPR